MGKRLPEHVRVRSGIVLRTIEKAKNIPCPRCGGEGYMDRSDWRVTEGDGRRACFRCHGSGTAERKYAHPVKVRYGVAKDLRALVAEGNVEEIQEREDAAVHEIYWPILEDVYARAIQAAVRQREVWNDAETLSC